MREAGQHTLYLQLFSNRFLAGPPLRTVRVDIITLASIDMIGTLGQTTRGVICVEGGRAQRRVSCWSSDASVLGTYEGELVLLPHAIKNEIPIYLHDTGVCTKVNRPFPF